MPDSLRSLGTEPIVCSAQGRESRPADSAPADLRIDQRTQKVLHDIIAVVKIRDLYCLSRCRGAIPRVDAKLQITGIGGTMLRAVWSTCVLAGCILCASAPGAAQEVIHALTGTVSAINPSTKTITVFEDNGSKGVFQEMANPKTRIAFDKRVADESTAVGNSTSRVLTPVVFYFGSIDSPTVVAVKNLAPDLSRQPWER